MEKDAQAEYLSLASRAVSEAARSLVELVYADVTAWELKHGKRSYKRGVSAASQFSLAIERIIGDLLRAHGTGNAWLYRSRKSESFTGDVVSYRDFTAATEAMAALKLLMHRPGTPKFLKAFGASMNLIGNASTYKAMGKLLRAAADFGINSKNTDEHFHLEAPREPLVLREGAIRFSGKKKQGARLIFEDTETTERLSQQVSELNTFLAKHVIKGGLHYGYFRGFNEGNLHQPYNWNKGGRLYSTPAQTNYQQQPSSKRAHRPETKPYLGQAVAPLLRRRRIETGH
jgi:hypothetical protein